jgi:hypothetical protein
VSGSRIREENDTFLSHIIYLAKAFMNYTLARLAAQLVAVGRRRLVNSWLVRPVGTRWGGLFGFGAQNGATASAVNPFGFS